MARSLGRRAPLVGFELRLDLNPSVRHPDRLFPSYRFTVSAQSKGGRGEGIPAGAPFLIGLIGTIKRAKKTVPRYLMMVTGVPRRTAS
jgi:hypothetical protein